MQSLIKFFATVSAFLCTVIFILIYVGNNVIPDKITIIENSNYNAPKILGADIYNSNYSDELNASVEKNRVSQNNAQIELLNIIPIKDVKITNTKRRYVVLGGQVFGIKLYTNGVIVVGTDTIETENGIENPAEKAKLKIGDTIKKYNDITIESTAHFSKLLQENKGETAILTVMRAGEELKLNFASVKENISGKYKAGLWVRDSSAGIGTVTFYNPENNSFGGLGHPICDVDTNEIMPMKNGEMAEAYVNSFYKSSNGNIGELCGVLTGKCNGSLCINGDTGIYGFLSNQIDGELTPVAVRQEITLGDAQILCTIDKNPPQYYDAKITKIFSNSNSVNKDMIIEITDEELLNQTGGILQGMSGTPIIQNGMLVGAITHVFVNNAKQGYAIFAERMLETSESREMEKYLQLQNAS